VEEGGAWRNQGVPLLPDGLGGLFLRAPCALLILGTPPTPSPLQASRRVFVPLTVGGGIRGFKDANGTSYSALDVAASYFRCGRALASRHAARAARWGCMLCGGDRAAVAALGRGGWTLLAAPSCPACEVLWWAAHFMKQEEWRMAALCV